MNNFCKKSRGQSSLGTQSTCGEGEPIAGDLLGVSFCVKESREGNKVADEPGRREHTESDRCFWETLQPPEKAEKHSKGSACLLGVCQVQALWASSWDRAPSKL